jgi:septum formation protein
VAPLLLASTSPYRRALLQRLGLPFEVVRPDVDEAPLAGEPAATLAARLARAKAAAVAAIHPDAWVIGSDQVADHGGTLLGKPGSRANAVAQLRSMSSGAVQFHTAVCVRGPGGETHALDATRVRFRALSTEEIERYVDAEQPFDCAGSFKAEGMGIALFEAIESEDPTALVGLPLIATARLLREAGFRIP